MLECSFRLNFSVTPTVFQNFQFMVHSADFSFSAKSNTNAMCLHCVYSARHSGFHFGGGAELTRSTTFENLEEKAFICEIKTKIDKIFAFKESHDFNTHVSR